MDQNGSQFKQAHLWWVSLQVWLLHLKIYKYDLAYNTLGVELKANSYSSSFKENNADEMDYGRIKNHSLSESILEDAHAWPIMESDGEAVLDGDSELGWK
ncbi:hypothetical protein TorRG33x02_161680 [Trema orientale]|uniref:Uncharacterized protein n=1 Tax=Trema orientale TaxID=63057 RepID=A0A2P5ER10_TREOI|nr:hypothetical protein TorRG33x02_161680 [Trema orientale]